MNGTELKEARKGMGLSQPAFARAVNAWWASMDGEPASYDQPRISNLERAERIPVKIQWFISEQSAINVRPEELWPAIKTGFISDAG